MADFSPSSVASLGPEGSFSHEFAAAMFPNAQLNLDSIDFDEVVTKVELGEVEMAVVPFLNSNGIDVRPAQVAIANARNKVFVVGCRPHKVVHNLVVADGFKALARVISKEQVFPQCDTWLQQWGEIELCTAPSTSAALRDLLLAPLAEREKSGAICNQLAVDRYGGTIRWTGIQNPGNVTLFLILTNRQPALIPEDALICLTCPTEECYQNTVRDFAAAGMPLMFTSLRGEFTENLPCFLQFQVNGKEADLHCLLKNPYRNLIGTFSPPDSLAACVGGFFDDSY